MAKDISRLLQKGNLTPKERHFLRVANFVSKEKTGKAILSDADEYALIDGWQPTTNDEVKEFNRYNQAWKTAMFAEMDAQTTYLHAKLKYQSMTGLLHSFIVNPVYSEVKEAIAELDTIKRVEAKEAIDIINRQRQEKLERGIELEQAIYRLALELIGEETKKRLHDLCEDIDIESEYLDDEQELAELYKKKDFAGIAERVAKRGRNTYTGEYQLFHFYACIPTDEIARRYAKDNNLSYEETELEGEVLNEWAKKYKDKIKEHHPEKYKKYKLDEWETTDEDLKKTTRGELTTLDKLIKTLEKHAQGNKTTIEDIIKTACLKYINEGLLEKEYTPLVIADPELLNKWIETKDKARQTIEELVSKGVLKQETYTGVKTMVFKGNTTKTDIAGTRLEGKSLYDSGLDYAFVKEFKDYADHYDPDLGILQDDKGEHIDTELLITEEKFFSRHKFLLERAKGSLEALSIVKEKNENGELILEIENTKLKELLIDLRNDFVKNYEILLGFQAFFKRLSKAYDMDLSYRIDIWVAECERLVVDFNDTLLDALKTILPYSPHAGKKRYKDTELFIDTEKITPNKERVEPAFKEVGELLGDDF